MATVTINLAAAGLTHARGQSDGCGDNGHDIPWTAVKGWDNRDLIDAADLTPILQALHEQAHPGGTADWMFCRQPGCADAYDLI
jgi:hypothetical protein